MLDEQKQLLQAKHRLEEAQARDLVKERKARTRRLIQEGAILEKAFPWVKNVQDLSELEDILCVTPVFCPRFWQHRRWKQLSEV